MLGSSLRSPVGVRDCPNPVAFANSWKSSSILSLGACISKGTLTGRNNAVD